MSNHPVPANCRPLLKENGHRPQCHHRSLFVTGELCIPWFAKSWIGPQSSKRQHIRIRPAPGSDIWSPCRSSLELRQQSLRPFQALHDAPMIPDIIAGSPHFSIFRYLLCMLQSGWAGRQAQHDGSSRFADCLADHAYFARLIRMIRNAIDFDKVHAPGGIQAQDRIVVCLTGGVFSHSEIVSAPGTGIRFIGCIARVKLRAGDSQVLLDGFFRNPAQNVNSEFQAERVDII